MQPSDILGQHVCGSEHIQPYQFNAMCAIFRMLYVDDGPSIVWEALEQQIAWEPKTVSRWDYKMLMDFATIAGVEAGGMMPTVAVWSCQTNVYQLAAMQHFAVTGRSHLSDGKVSIALELGTQLNHVGMLYSV